MKYKKSIIVVLLAIFLFSITTVCASEIDTPIASEDTTQIGLSDSDKLTEDNLQTSEENPTLTENDETLSSEIDSQILTADQFTYSYLRDKIGSGGDINLTKGTYTYNDGDGETIVLSNSGVINGNGAVIDMNHSGYRAFEVTAYGVTIKNLTIKNANYTGNGGAIYFSNYGIVTNCNFINNSATQNGGAVYFDQSIRGTIVNCNFTDNKATGDGGAVYFRYYGTVTNCSFIDNHAEEWGGAVYIRNKGSVTNCNFTNNNATKDGGAIRILSGGVTKCNFNNNTASDEGGAIIMESGTVTNCNFVNNTVTKYGGAVYFNDDCEMANCNFVNNTATNNGGGAVFFSCGGSVTNCSFTLNTASRYSGAVYFTLAGSVTNCNFTDNKATGNTGYGGAVFFRAKGTVTNCSFVNNTAGESGGAIRFYTTSTVKNCNFTGNNAPYGSAIYFYSESAVKTVSNSCFLNNRANAKELQIIKNENSITITFTGNDNLLNAIYSKDGVSFTNVTYWGEDGVTNTGSSTIKPIMSDSSANQNITVRVVVNDELVFNKVEKTDKNGMIVLDISAGENYYISARHEADSYYTEIQNINTNMKFYANVTAQTTHNKTVNITAKSNILSGVIYGKLLFIVPNGENITATYAGNDTWWAEYTFDDYGEYEVKATYSGLDNVTINNETITISKADSTLTVGDIVFDYEGFGSTNVSFKGATGVNASVVGQSNAKVSVDGNTITVSGLNAGTYTLTVTTIADGDHNNVTKTATITVNPLKTELSADAITATYNINKDLVITLKDGAGKALTGVKISVDLNGVKEYTTDANGQVKVQTKGLVPKTYAAKITFNGNTNYEKTFKEVKVTVKKATPKIIAKKKTYKAKATKKFTITLKDNTGKPIKKVKVRLFVKKIAKKTKKTKPKNKKKVKKNIKKTNKKGKATFIIDRTKKAKYWVTVKFYGNKYFKAITKKVKITIK